MAIAAAAALAAGMARADVYVLLVIDGYSETFKECEFGLGFDAPDYAKVVLGYEIHVNDRPISRCDATWNAAKNWIDTSCSGESGVEYSCEELTKIKPVSLTCLDAAGASMNCGTLTIEGPKIFTFD